MATMPVAVDRALVQRGAKIFETYCRVCHGGYGDGKGITTSYGMLNPPSYHSDRLREMGDGEMLKTITEGKGQMGPYADRIALEDRWAAIAFVRALQRAGDARLDDVPEAERAKLESGLELP
jgi:mono/diheme cytochrome c family protein